MIVGGLEGVEGVEEGQEGGIRKVEVLNLVFRR
jgi:hypothetical protein